MLPIAKLLAAAPRPPRAAAASWSAPPSAGAGLAVGFGAGPRRSRRRPARARGAAVDAVRGLPADRARQHRHGALAHLEMGQGTYTGLATLVAEELDADWARCAPSGAGRQPDALRQPRLGGASRAPAARPRSPAPGSATARPAPLARAMLVAAAAEEWGVPAAEIRGREGRAAPPRPAGARPSASWRRAAGRRRAGRMRRPTSRRSRTRSDFDADRQRRTCAGSTASPRPPARPLFTIDVRLPGMLTAVVAHPPRFGAKVRSLRRRRRQGGQGRGRRGRDPARRGGGRRDTWAAIKGREALHGRLGRERRRDARLRGAAGRVQGSCSTGRRRRGRAQRRRRGRGALAARREASLEAEFEFPYLAHAAMEPLNAVARLRDGCSRSGAATRCQTSTRRSRRRIAGCRPSRCGCT